MHLLTPNGFSKIALLVRAVKHQNVIPDINAFCSLHEMHTQLKNAMDNGKGHQIFWM